MNNHAERKDFFVSYNHADEDWATWIAWVLESEGYSTIIQAWDFRPGSNFAIEMDQAVARSDRTIAVVSENFLNSTFTAPEWAAAFAKDPSGIARKLVPVRVEPCDTEGLLGQVVRIDLVGLDRDAAAARLLSGLQLGRSKPSGEPPFPRRHVVPSPAASSTSVKRPQEQPTWKPLGAPIAAKWQVVGDRYNNYGGTVVEVQLLPTDQQRVEVRRLQAVKDDLAAAARATGLISQSGALEATSSDQLASVRSAQSRQDPSVGLTVGRNGALGGWLSLPADGLGAVLDVDDLTARLEQLLKILTNFDVATSDRYAVAIGIANAMMLTLGSTSIIGKRTSASSSFGRDNVVIEADDSVSIQALREDTKSIAEELVARLLAGLNSR